MAGEFSVAVNDCSLYLNNVGQGSRFDGSYIYPNGTGGDVYGDCDPWNDWENYNKTTKDNLKDFALVQMDSLRNFFFWNWKIGDSIETGKPVNPMWSYKLGLQEGWMPENPKPSRKELVKRLVKSTTSRSPPSPNGNQPSLIG